MANPNKQRIQTPTLNRKKKNIGQENNRHHYRAQTNPDALAPRKEIKDPH